MLVSLGQETVQRAVAALPALDREGIRRRFGMDGDPKPETHAAIGRELGLSTSRVREIEERALTDLARLREIQAFGVDG